MNNNSDASSHHQTALIVKVITVSSVVAIVGSVSLLFDFFPCQSVDWLHQRELHFMVLLQVFYIFFLLLLLWPVWWSIFSSNLTSSQKLVSFAKTTFIWGIIAYIPWFLGSILIGTFLPKIYTLMRPAVALLGLNLTFWRKIKFRERRIAFIPWVISVAICLATFFSDSPYITPNNFYSKLSEFQAVVALVDTEQLIRNNVGIVELPCEYSHLSNKGSKFAQGYIFTKQDEGATVLTFWQRDYALRDGDDYIIYRSDNKDISTSPDLLGNEVRKLQDHWFWQGMR